ncbi:MAG TPA: hypothetical protein VGC09_10455 [Rhodopila sp.]
MRAIIENTCFHTDTRIRIAAGADEMLFLRCSFEGGEIFIEQEVDRTIFSQCVFRGTHFSGQRLSARIAVGCQSALADTEATSGVAAVAGSRFRS